MKPAGIFSVKLVNEAATMIAGATSADIASIKGDEFLRTHRWYKTLSLRVASRIGIPILPTILVDRQLDDAQAVTDRVGVPAMIRVDYTTLPAEKPLGGIPLGSLTAIERVTKDLLKRKLYPLFHPHIDRFSNMYSVGILISPNSLELNLDIVGQGFDASDLRLGVASPHEAITYMLAEGQISERKIIRQEQYSVERQRRAERSERLRKYAEYVNHEGHLLASLRRFSPTENEVIAAIKLIPAEYKIISSEQLSLLITFASRIRVSALPQLPGSEAYVASFSLLPGRGWILWDIYGSWYRR
jgi:hypothetical protein